LKLARARDADLLFAAAEAFPSDATSPGKTHATLLRFSVYEFLFCKLDPNPRFSLSVAIGVLRRPLLLSQILFQF
jgi:hypothetical protein